MLYLILMDMSSAYVDEIINNLKILNIDKIVLFGSFAKNNTHTNSDIDLLVILDSDEIAQNYEQRMKKKLYVRNCIMELSKRVSIDLIVYTKAEYKIISENKTSFIKELEKTGKVVYEKAS